VSPVANTGGPILINEVVVAGNPLLEWSQDGGVTFSTDWDSATPGTQTLAAKTSSTIDITATSGAGSSITLGDLSSAASNNFALINLGPVTTPANVSLIIDDRSSTDAAGSYDFLSTLGTITGPGGSQGGINFTSFGPINSYLIEGGPAGNTFNIHSTFNGTVSSTTIIGGAGNDIANVLGDTSPGIGTPLSINLEGGANTVHVGNGNVSATVSAAVAVTETGGTTNLNVDNLNDMTSSTVTLDNLSGNLAAPYEVKVQGAGPIEYGAGVPELNINGGKSSGGTAGVLYNINNTQAGTTTTINGGSKANTYTLSIDGDPGGLDNLPGPVVIDGGGAGDDVDLWDTGSNANDNYTVTGTTVTCTGAFGGLTYGSLGAGGALCLYASNGNNITDVTSTANAINTMVFGDNGTDEIDVTGTGGSLNIQTGNTTAQASTVNVFANNEPVNITSVAAFPAITTVNIGSAGIGPQTMAGIQGPISVDNDVSLTALNFDDGSDMTGQTWTLNNNDGVSTGTVAVTGSATTTYDPTDLSELTVNGGSGGNTFHVNNTSGFYPTTLNTGIGSDVVQVYATGANILDINGQAGSDQVRLGGSLVAPLGMQRLHGTINVGNATGTTALYLDDSEDTTGQGAALTNDGTNGKVTGLSPATINYTDSGTNSLTVHGGSGGNTFTVNGTIPTDLYTGAGDNTTYVQATNADGPLNIPGEGGQDAVFIGFFGSLADIHGPVFVDNAPSPPGFTDLTVDSSTDAVSHNFTLSSSAPDSFLDGLAPAQIAYDTAALSSLTIKTSDFGTQVMNIDMKGGNPIPVTDKPGLTWNASPDGTGGFDTHALNIFDELPTGPFASETHNANAQSVFPQVGQYGSIFFDHGQKLPSSLTSLWYTGLSPIVDTTPAVNYTFNDFGYPDQSFSATTGPVITGFQTLEFASTPTPPSPTNFETTDIANKNFVTFNTPAAIPGVAGPGIIGVVNVPTPSAGLLSLTFNTPSGGDNNVSFVSTPPGVVTSLNGGADEDVTNVTGRDVAAGTVLFLNGGPSTNTLNYDAGGKTPTITPGLLPGEVLISIAGAGTVDAINYQQINITDVSPLVITPGPAAAINTVEGFQNVDAIVGTFTAPIPILAPPGGLTASDFTASIDWGDPSVDAAAGTITQDASNPSVYYIIGTHTFTENGTYKVANSVAFAGGTFTAPVNGVPISIKFGPAGPTPGTTATATVTQGTLAVSVFPIVGTEGIAIPAGPIATFIDAGGADSIANYSAGIIISGPNYLVAYAATVSQNGDAAQLTVNSLAGFTLPEEGTYQVQVLVTDKSGATPITAQGASTPVIADATLTAGAATLLTPTTGIALPNSTVVATFKDANTTATAADFTAAIDSGNGLPPSTGIGVVVATGTPGVFDVEGGNTYSRPGDFTTLVTVHDDGGSQVLIIGSATVSDPSLSGSAHNITSTEDASTGNVVLATIDNPNLLATNASLTAVMTTWGDGSPSETLPVNLIGSTATNTIFEVTGSHVYTEEGTYTFSITVTTTGGKSLTVTGTATVLDATLSSSNGPEINGIEGNTTGTITLGTFVDANQGATVNGQRLPYLRRFGRHHGHRHQRNLQYPGIRRGRRRFPTEGKQHGHRGRQLDRPDRPAQSQVRQRPVDGHHRHHQCESA